MYRKKNPHTKKKKNYTKNCGQDQQKQIRFTVKESVLMIIQLPGKTGEL